MFRMNCYLNHLLYLVSFVLICLNCVSHVIIHTSINKTTAGGSIQLIYMVSDNNRCYSGARIDIGHRHLYIKSMSRLNDFPMSRQFLSG